jgi:hypothetical protein
MNVRKVFLGKENLAGASVMANATTMFFPKTIDNSSNFE